MKRITILTLALLLMVVPLTGCKDEPPQPPVVENRTSLDAAVKMSTELNKYMNTTDDIGELTRIFDSYMDRMGEQTYLTNFNTKSLVVASAYYREYGVDTYQVKETIVTESDNKTIVYIAYEVTAGIPGEVEEAGLIEITLKGLNKYTYSNDKLVDFARVL